MAGNLAGIAAQYQGAGYVFGGVPARGIGNWDCSSFVNWCAGAVGKMAIPGFAAGAYTGQSHGPVVLDWATWTGATTIPGPPANSDLCIWPGLGASGHMGIAVDGQHMISALNHSKGTLFSPIAGFGPMGIPVMYRRINGSASGGGISLPTGCANLIPGLGLIWLVMNALRNQAEWRRNRKSGQRHNREDSRQEN